MDKPPLTLAIERLLESRLHFKAVIDEAVAAGDPPDYLILQAFDALTALAWLLIPSGPENTEETGAVVSAGPDAARSG